MNKRFIFTLFLVATAVSKPSLADDLETLSPRACTTPTKKNVTYSQVIELPTGRPDHSITYGEDPLQYAELWLPAITLGEERPPLVILIHGGCWLNAYDITHTHALSTALAHSGYAVLSVEYRRTGDSGGGWPGSLDDIISAIEVTMSEQFIYTESIDLESVAIVGHSAGGHLALLAGSVLKDRQNIKAVIGLAAITDIERYSQGENSCEKATVQFMGGSVDQLPEKYADANPMKQIPHSNTILLHGSQDKIVDIEQSSYVEGASLVTVEGGGHFDMVHPGTTSFQALLKQLAQAL